MIFEVRLPELGEKITEAGLTAVLVKPGDMVGLDTGIVEVETDKAAIEVPAQVAGKVTEVLVAAGARIKVGQVLVKVETGDAAAVAPITASAQSAKQPTPAAPAVASPVAPAPAVAPAATSPVPTTVAAPTASGGEASAAPFTRRLAREMGIDLAKVTGTGPGGRISPEDVAAYAKRIIAGGGAPAIPSLPDLSKWGTVRREAMTGIRRTTAGNMVISGSIPTVTQFDRADITSLEETRKKLNAGGGLAKLTVTAFAVKAVAGLLREFPKFNAMVDMGTSELVFREFISIGVAVDTPRGLMVPVLRGADGKGLRAIADEINGLAGKARDKKLTVDEMRGGTFSLSNLGGLGTTYFTPLLNWPDVAVLGLGRSEWTPILTGKEFTPRFLLPLSLTYDHRVIDGAEAARFLRRLAETLEKPEAIPQ